MLPIKTKTAEFSYLEEDILLVNLIEDAEIDIIDVDESFEATMQVTQGKKYAAFIDAAKSVHVTSEARAYGARKEFQLNLIAQAIFINSLANRIVGNFIIRFNKPYAPTKLFSDKQAALIWLREQILKQKAIQ